MKYMGSKNRITKEILPIMLKERGQRTWVEPFVGGANTIDKVGGERIGADINPYLIDALIAIRDCVTDLPKNNNQFTEADYKVLRKSDDYKYKGYAGFAFSYSGKWLGGWCRDGLNKRDYVNESYKNAINQSPLLQGVRLVNESYLDLQIPDNSLIYCFDEETELLTDKGFKLVKDISLEDRCLSREPNTRVVEYVTIDKLYQRFYKGNFYSYEGKNISINVTEDHNLFVSKKQTRKKLRRDLLIKAKDSIEQDIQFISANGVWYGNDSDIYNVLGVDYNATNFAYLVGIFCTDGSINNQDIININQSKEHIIIKIRECLNNLKIDYTENIFEKSKWMTTFYLSRKYVSYFKQFYLKENRKIPNDLLQYNTEVLKSLLEGIIDGDGSDGRRIYLGSKSLVDNIQEICYKIGKSSCYTSRGKGKKSWYEKEQRWITSKKDYYIISVNNKHHLNCVKSNIKIEYKEQDVYCVTLSKWNTVLSRRNGKCIWIGQCDPPYEGTTKYKDDFNHTEFWDWCRDMASKGYIIFVSEYNAPKDFECVWQKEIVSSLTQNTGSKKAVEKLFKLPSDIK